MLLKTIFFITYIKNKKIKNNLFLKIIFIVGHGEARKYLNQSRV